MDRVSCDFCLPFRLSVGVCYQCRTDHFQVYDKDAPGRGQRDGDGCSFAAQVEQHTVALGSNSNKIPARRGFNFCSSAGDVFTVLTRLVAAPRFEVRVRRRSWMLCRPRSQFQDICFPGNSRTPSRRLFRMLFLGFSGPPIQLTWSKRTPINSSNRPASRNGAGYRPRPF